MEKVKDHKIIQCNECQKLFVDSIFCLTCGSANVAPVSDGLPFIDKINTCCQECGEDCETWEAVCIVAGVHESKNPKDWKIWCYCEKCDIETFHDL